MDRSITSSPEQFLEITPKKISRQRVGWGGGRAKHVFTFDPRLRRSCAGPGFKVGLQLQIWPQRSRLIFQDWDQVKTWP